MNKIVSYLLLFICSMMCTTNLFAQVADKTNVMLDNGKIYVVVAVCLTILIGLVIYIFLLDRRISRMEKGKD